ncbi:hypothetical protein [Streptococcus mitis]|uniref:hypothetical protein n=1 Tax=Streptococcus mitis TaxID=28037 RepID=UPI0039C14AA2
MKNIQNDCGRTKTDIDTIKKEIQVLAKEKSKCYSLDFSKKEDVELFFGEEDFTELDVQANLETK